MITATSTTLPGALPIGELVRETDTGIIRRRTAETTWLEVGRRYRLSRTAGFRLPEGVTNVARPGKWGNPWVIEHLKRDEMPWTVTNRTWPVRAEFATEDEARGFAVERHGLALSRVSSLSHILKVTVDDVLREIGPDPRVACWCHLEDLCHGDNLLEVIARRR